MDNKEKHIDFKGLPDIEEYLTFHGDKVPVEIPELDQVVSAVTARTKLTEDQASQVVRLFFQEIRGILLRGGCVELQDLGQFVISSPKTTGNSKKIFPKFKASRSLSRRMNAK
jgi:nucleoid DNA-binding protein